MLTILGSGALRTDYLKILYIYKVSIKTIMIDKLCLDQYYWLTG